MIDVIIIIIILLYYFEIHIIHIEISSWCILALILLIIIIIIIMRNLLCIYHYNILFQCKYVYICVKFVYFI